MIVPMPKNVDEVQKMDRFTICRLHRFLTSEQLAENPEVAKALWKRFQDLGGFTPAISKQVGWDPH